jgi:hypothetical protein
MIRSELHVMVECDRCTDGLTADHDRPTGRPTAFLNRPTALAALGAALTSGGWVRLFDGRLLCPACAAEQTCRDCGHDYAVDGWRMCACDRSIPTHTFAPPDPARGDGCGIAWRLCGRCDHIDEHHITGIPVPDPWQGPHCHDQVPGDAVECLTCLTTGSTADTAAQAQPGGSLRQDVPAGLALPVSDPHPTGEHMIRRETPMVEPFTAPDGGQRAGSIGGAR